MTDKIPTADEFILKEYETDDINKVVAESHHIIWMMQEFAKLHVQAALLSASIKAKATKDEYSEYNGNIEVSSILEAYPFENIK